MTWEPPATTQKRSRQTASAILWGLYIGGEATSETGQATKVLERRMRGLDLWQSGAARNYLFVCTKLATPEWGEAISRDMTSTRRCRSIRLNLSIEDMPPPPVGWSAKKALEKAEAVVAAESDSPSRLEKRELQEDGWVWPTGMRNDTQNTVRAILWTLHDLGGAIESDRGHATQMLLEETEQRTGVKMDHTARWLLSRLWGAEDGVAYFGRQVLERTGDLRQNYRIDLLLPEASMPRRPVVLEGAADGEDDRDGDAVPAGVEEQVFQPEVLGAASEPEPETAPPEVAVDDDPIDLLLAAQRLTTQAILAFAARPQPFTVDPLVDDTVLRRLSDALEDNQRLRRRASEMEAARNAKMKEVDTVRRLLAETQANLDAVRGAVSRNGTDRLMRQAPTTH